MSLRVLPQRKELVARASTLRQAQGPLRSDDSAVLTPLSEEDPSS